LDFQPDGPVVDVGEPITIGPREFLVTNYVLKREVRYLDGRTESIVNATPNGEQSSWFQVSGRLTNVGESLVPAPSLDDFRVHHRGGRTAPIYRIDEVGGWGYLREEGLDDPISKPGLEPNTTYLEPQKSVGFEVLFVVTSGSEFYLEWDTPSIPDTVYVHVVVND
jgi:hypothetical protein